MILIHSTHEAGFKLGGIGAVLDGLLSAPGYLAQVDRTLLVGTMHTDDALEMDRLFGPHNGLQVTFFATGNLFSRDCTPALAAQLGAIEGHWGARLLYGQRPFGGALHEILLVDPTNVPRDRLNDFKYFVWERFGLASDRYESEYEFDQFMSASVPAFEALKVILEAGLSKFGPGSQPVVQSKTQGQDSKIILCHEFMGLPLWYAAEVAQPGTFKSVYIAHEVPTARRLVEDNPGHDTRFYNVMRTAHSMGLSIDEVFGDQTIFFKHAMVKTAAQCDLVLAVGDLVVDELRFVDVHFRDKRIDLVYNGVNARHLTLPDVRAAKAGLCDYAHTLTELRPTFVFSHATRMVVSKALWRDLRVMEALDPLLAARNESAVLFLLSSVIPQGRTPAEAQRMAQEYGWPRDHQEGWPDLIAHEVTLWKAITALNAKALASRVVLINQFGFSRDRCGDSMPPDLSFDDLRNGTDLEFGMSVYEPFGIAQIEPLPSGALCVVSDVCGCLGFINRQLSSDTHITSPHTDHTLVNAKAGKHPFPNVLRIDFTTLPEAGTQSAQDVLPAPADPDLVSPAATSVSPDEPANSWHTALAIDQAMRDAVEQRAVHNAAADIMARLPRDDTQKELLMQSGAWLALQMSWDIVAREQFMPVMLR